MPERISAIVAHQHLDSQDPLHGGRQLRHLFLVRLDLLHSFDDLHALDSVRGRVPTREASEVRKVRHQLQLTRGHFDRGLRSGCR